jgi:putative hydrolase of the HAD superfamily
MSITTLFIDVDDTLYSPSTGIWGAIGARIDLYMVERLHLPPDQVAILRRRLFQTYGTTLRGLVITMHIDPVDYLDFVHDVPVAQILKPDLELREMLSTLSQRKVIFTNADQKHAQRVLTALQIADCFERIIDIVDIYPFCKPQPDAFEIALRLTGERDPAQCILVDDGVPNLAAAHKLGFRAVRVGNAESLPEYDTGIACIHELPHAIQRLL